MRYGEPHCKTGTSMTNLPRAANYKRTDWKPSLKPTETIIMAVGNWQLIFDRAEPILPWCWFQDYTDEGFRADMRNDGRIYMSGHRTQLDAETWAKGKGII